jgi:hypothetical protein
MQELERRNALLHLRISSHALLASQPEPYSLEPLKHVPVLCIGADVQRALAFGGVRKEIRFVHGGSSPLVSVRFRRDQLFGRQNAQN